MLRCRGKPPPIILTGSGNTDSFLSPSSTAKQAPHSSSDGSSDSNSPESEEERVYLSIILDQIASNLPLIYFDAWTAASIGDQSYFCANVDNAIFAKNRGGWTPLMYASFYGHVGVASIIVEQAPHSHLNDVNYARRSALMLAVAAGRASTLEILLAHHADIEMRDTQDWTALMIAAHAGCTATAQVLLKYGANVNTREGVFGQTALYLAALSGSKEIVALLIKYGADPEIGTFHNDTPLAAALRNGRTATAALLSKKINDSLNVPSVLMHRPVIHPSTSSLKLPPQYGTVPYGKYDLRCFLEWHNLGDIVPLLENNDIDWEVFLTMTQEDFSKIGIKNKAIEDFLVRLVQQCRASQQFHSDLRQFQSVWSHLKLLLLKLNVHVMSRDLIESLAEGSAGCGWMREGGLIYKFALCTPSCGSLVNYLKEAFTVLVQTSNNDYRTHY